MFYFFCRACLSTIFFLFYSGKKKEGTCVQCYFRALDEEKAREPRLCGLSTKDVRHYHQADSQCYGLLNYFKSDKPDCASQHKSYISQNEINNHNAFPNR